MDPEDPDSDPDHSQNLIISSFYHFGHILKILSKSICQFLKVLTKIFFKLSRPKGNLCGGMTVLNPKYPRLSSGDTMIQHTDIMTLLIYSKIRFILVATFAAVCTNILILNSYN